MAVPVLVMPDYGDSNPYQLQLQEALADLGITVVSDDGTGLFPVFRGYLENDRPRILHLHWLHPYLMGEGPIITAVKGIRLMIELLLLRWLGVRVIWTVHNLIEHDRRAPRVEATCKHLILRLIDAGIVHCESARDAVIETYRLPPRLKSKLSVIPHGHYIDWYPNDISRAEARADLEIPESSTVFLFFGHIHPYKNVTGLVSAFGEVDDARVGLFVVGQPSNSELADELTTLCQRDERIRTDFGYVPDEAVQRYMKAADVVVLPYYDGLTSGAAILAASFGRPIIAPDRGCIGDRFGTGSDLIYDPEREPLTRVLARGLEADTETVGRRNRERVETPTWLTIAELTADVYFNK
jgi:glycosyltransferase involved in cell wall biosynthesis